MAADVDKGPAEQDSHINPENEPRAWGPGSWRSGGLRILVLVAAVPLLAFGIKKYQDDQLLKRHEASIHSLGSEGFFLFSSLDNDHDLYLSPEEFKPIVEKLTGVLAPADSEENPIHDPDGETLTLEAKMQPLLLDSMTKSKDGFLGDKSKPDPARNLLRASSASREKHQHLKL